MKIKERLINVVSYGTYWTVQTFWYAHPEYRLLSEVRIRQSKNLLGCIDRACKDWDKSGLTYTVRIN